MRVDIYVVNPHGNVLNTLERSRNCIKNIMAFHGWTCMEWTPKETRKLPQERS